MKNNYGNHEAIVAKRVEKLLTIEVHLLRDGAVDIDLYGNGRLKRIAGKCDLTREFVPALASYVSALLDID